MKEDAIPRGLSFLTGTAMGLALGFYLHSEKGSALRKQLTENWGDALNDLGERAQDQLGELLNSLNAALDNGLNFAEILETQLQTNLSAAAADTRDAVEDAETSFENGMDKARAKLLQKFAEAEKG